jgi:thiamine biosynthesis lipoprotein ApbE
VSPELRHILGESDRWRVASGGAFDPRVEVYSRLWKRAEKSGHVPGKQQIADAHRSLGGTPWTVDNAGGTATLLTNAPLSFNAIAKGYIVERACDAAMALPGVRGVLLNVGGDMTVRGEMPGVVGIAPANGDSESAEPEVTIEVNDRSVATSGNAYRGFRINNRWYSHIIDPRTGYPARDVVTATVIARRGADADALATICNVLSPTESLRLVEDLPDAACRIVTRDGRVFASARWASYAQQDQKPKDEAQKQKGAPVASAGLPDDFECAVEFTINRPEEAGRYRRPYVVIWVEDKDGIAVRTVSLWVSLGGSGPDRWIPDLARWYRGDAKETSRQRKNLIYTMSRPTRAPGQYTVIWDLKDSAGKPVPPGSYTLFIETAREHGTHQLMRKEISLGTSEFNEDIAGNVEIKSATIRYRRKSEPK